MSVSLHLTVTRKAPQSFNLRETLGQLIPVCGYCSMGLGTICSPSDLQRVIANHYCPEMISFRGSQET
jgi:hypothetical protein